MDKLERRQRILNHARDIFARRGYHEAKIDDIVAAAGIARGTFYLYFEDKRTVFEAIVDRAFTQIGMAIVRVDPKDKGRTVADQIHENIRRIVGTLLEDRSTTKILLTDAVGLDPAFDRKLQSFYGIVENLLVESLREGQALGVVAPGDARMFAYLALGAMKEVLCQVVRREAPYAEKEIVEGIYDFLGQGCLRVREPVKKKRG
ncbi:MAG: TetR/AcrR family transcriptional regulator [Myxococcota bacterium]|nr:TetR/AcrR family transcriptional regulator [Myxococcota bacterium]